MIILNMMYDSIEVQNTAIVIVKSNLMHSILADHAPKKMIFKRMIIKLAEAGPQIDLFCFVVTGKMEEYQNSHALLACSHKKIYPKNSRKQKGGMLSLFFLLLST